MLAFSFSLAARCSTKVQLGSLALVPLSYWVGCVQGRTGGRPPLALHSITLGFHRSQKVNALKTKPFLLQPPAPQSTAALCYGE